MDRDIALQIVTKIGALTTSLEALATNTSPSNPNRGGDLRTVSPVVDESDVRSLEEIPDEVVENDPAPEEIETRKTKGGK